MHTHAQQRTHKHSLVFFLIYSFVHAGRLIHTHTHTQVEGFFMINQYHMALINDNDFGLDGKDF